jgi:hypothetical protein
MGSHPNRSRHLRTVTLKISDGGRMVACHPENTSDLCMRVTAVPRDVSDAKVAAALWYVCWLPFGDGPWTVPWERIKDAPRGAILRDCADHSYPAAIRSREMRTELHSSH